MTIYMQCVILTVWRLQTLIYVNEFSGTVSHTCTVAHRVFGLVDMLSKCHTFTIWACHTSMQIAWYRVLSNQQSCRITSSIPFHIVQSATTPSRQSGILTNWQPLPILSSPKLDPFCTVDRSTCLNIQKVNVIQFVAEFQQMILKKVSWCSKPKNNTIGRHCFFLSQHSKV